MISKYILVSGAMLSIALSFGCEPKPKAPETKKEVKKVEIPKREKTVRGDAFGLPLPPRVRKIEERKGFIFVHTDMNINEVDTFFRKNLPKDYEVLRVRHTLRIIGLRAFSPTATAAHISDARSYVRIIYRAMRKTPNEIALRGSDTSPGEPGSKGSSSSTRPKSTYVRPKKGSPVLLKTHDGKLLAPGAKWGEPYWPPKGSPLHQRRYSGNWGKPFGTWQES